jgi:hypothetical protein|tara:strand:+ start:1076 stop:3007 length:1932 start_codon:yes stop_codon:yes gene_type:complete
MRSVAKKLTIYIFLSLIVIGCSSTDYNVKDFGISTRPEPLRDFVTNEVIRVSDFGALPNDDKIDTKAIQQAIDEAKRLKDNVKIVFEPGIYRMEASTGRYALSIDEADDIIFDGAGAEFMMVNPEILFMSVDNSNRVILRDFSVDYELSPFTQGYVKEVDPDKKWLKVEIDSIWPSPDSEHFRNADYKWAFIKDRNNLPAFKEGTEFRLYLTDWEYLSDNVWIYHTQYTSKLKTIEPGDPFVQISRVDGCLISASNSEDITLQKLRLYESPACMLGSGNSSRINYLDINMSPKPGSWMSAGADGCFNVNGREGPWVEGCTFNALGDDNLIIKGTGAYIIDVVNDSTFALVNARHKFVYPLLDFETYRKRDTNNKWHVREGDLLEVVDPLQGRVISEPKVTKVELLKNGIQVTVDRTIPGIRKGTSADSSITIFNQSNSLPGFVVKNNKFFNAPRFGFLLKSHDGVIINNHFKNNSDQSITMINSYQEFGSRSYNILIKGNTFEGAGGQPVKTAETAQHSLVRPHGRNIFSVVTAAFTLPNGQWDIIETEEIAIKNLHIVDNEFLNWRQLPALTVMNAVNVSIINNRFIRDPMMVTKDTLWLGKKPLRILYSKNVEVRGNKFIGEDIISEPVEIIKSEDVKLRK